MNSLKAITPIDGRYRNKVSELEYFFSETSFNQYRIYIEIKYLIHLSKYNIINLDSEQKKVLNRIYHQFNIEEAKGLKKIEEITNHDVKAVEYYIREKLENIDILNNKKIINHVHFGLTSQDINSSSNVLAMKDAIIDVLIPNIKIILEHLDKLNIKWINIPLLSMTHGQPASPTLFSKELLVFYERIVNQLSLLENINYTTKFGGAVGNFNAHQISYPNINWIEFADDFIHSLGLQRNNYTTQIDHYDNYSQIFDCIRRINVIMIDLCQDMWLYISRNVIKQKINPNEIGSSAMPHKVNPINFENAEGNLLLSNAILELLSRKLPVSRLQRDLTDSTLLRNIGTAFAYTLIGYKSLQTGLKKIDVNEQQISKELDDNYLVIAEALQTKMKVLGIDNSYEKIKKITRTNAKINELKLEITKFINDLEISIEEKEKLLNLTPSNYTGIFI